MKVRELLETAALQGLKKNKGITTISDAFFMPGDFPKVRYIGRLFPFSQVVPVGEDSREEHPLLGEAPHAEEKPLPYRPVSKDDLTEFLRAIIPQGTTAEKEFSTNKSAVVSVPLPKSGLRIRVKVIHTRKGPGVVARFIPKEPPRFEDLALPMEIADSLDKALKERMGGIFVISGEMGAGKSTTIASLVNRVGAEEALHIVTVEDCSEFVYPKGPSLITQREIPADSPSYEKALDDLLQMSSDLVVVGEVRSGDALRRIVSLAEAGVIVLCTIHAPGVMETMNRLMGLAGRDIELLARVATVLTLIAYQELVPWKDKSRVPKCELIKLPDQVRKHLAEGNFSQIKPYAEKEIKVYLAGNPVTGSPARGGMGPRRPIRPGGGL